MKARLVVNQLKVHPLSNFWFSDGVNLRRYTAVAAAAARYWPEAGALVVYVAGTTAPNKIPFCLKVNPPLIPLETLIFL